MYHIFIHFSLISFDDEQLVRDFMTFRNCEKWFTDIFIDKNCELNIHDKIPNKTFKRLQMLFALRKFLSTYWDIFSGSSIVKHVLQSWKSRNIILKTVKLLAFFHNFA